MRDLPLYRIDKVSFGRFRVEQAPAEKRLWGYIHNRRLGGFKFRRQVPIGPFIADFCCLEKRLVLELDGSHHARQQDADDNRTAYLATQGFRVLRFTNNDVLQDTTLVCRSISEALKVPSPIMRGGTAGCGR